MENGLYRLAHSLVEISGDKDPPGKKNTRVPLEVGAETDTKKGIEGVSNRKHRSDWGRGTHGWLKEP